jgi:MFS family permease
MTVRRNDCRTCALPSSMNPTRPPAGHPNGGSPDSNRNFALLAAHQAVMRIGWIFKTESVIMPAVFDILGGAAWLRGCLPMLSRMGQSVPPMVVADRIRRIRRQRLFLATCSAAMGIAFLLMAAAWQALFVRQVPTLIGVLITLYTLFFVAVGMQQVSLGILSGKLVLAERRGSLMSRANFVGGICAILCAWWLLRPWMRAGESHFPLIFLFAGTMFVSAGLLAHLLREPPAEPVSNQRSSWRNLQFAWRRARNDRNYRLLIGVCLLFGMAFTLFPHYQSLGRQRLALGLEHLVPWLIVQNVGVTLFSIPAGWIGDRWGNRLAARCLLVPLALTPLLALVISRWEGAGPVGYWLVFLGLGFLPITMRVVSNYTLEIAPQDDMSNYLSVTNLAMALPAILLSPLVGGAIDVWGFEPAFVVVSALIVLAFGLSHFLREPRQRTATTSAKWTDFDTEE